MYTFKSKQLKHLEDYGYNACWCKDHHTGYIFYHQYDYESEFSFVFELLFCEDIGVIYITDFLGNDSFYTCIEQKFSMALMSTMKKRYTSFLVEKIKTLLQYAYPEYKSIRLYSKGNYKAEYNKYMQCIWRRIMVFDVPALVQYIIHAYCKPVWMEYKRPPLTSVAKMRNMQGAYDACVNVVLKNLEPSGKKSNI